MFLTQSVREQSIQFVPTMNVPNERLLSAIQEVEDIGLILPNIYILSVKLYICFLVLYFFLTQKDNIVLYYLR